MLMITHSSCVAQVGILDWEPGPRLGYLHNDKHTKITSLEYLNAHDNTLFMCGSGRFWDWELGPRLGYLHNDNHKHTKITSLEYLNAHDNTLLMCGSGRYLGLEARSKTGVPT